MKMRIPLLTAVVILTTMLSTNLNLVWLSDVPEY